MKIQTHALIVRMRSLVGNIASWVVGAALPLSVPYAISFGYYTYACPEGAAGWSLLVMLVLPYFNPLLAIAVFVAAVIAGVLTQPLQSWSRFVRVIAWWFGLSVSLGLGSWMFAWLSEAHSQCRIGGW